MPILLVEDDQDLADIIAYTLKRAQLDVLTAYDGMSALRIAKSRQLSLILLDVNLPRIDGWAVLQQVRGMSTVPVIMLTACADEQDILRGLRLGADDYITKPFSPAQLVARVEAVLRRSHLTSSGARAQALEVGDIALDLGLHRVSVSGRTVNLTKIEFRLLQELALRAGEVVSHQELARRVWGYQEVDSGAVTKSHIRNLRRKIEADAARPAYIQTVAGLGYRLQAATARSAATAGSPA
jgi:DNA-binding response OmpR family regulator